MRELIFTCSSMLTVIKFLDSICLKKFFICKRKLYKFEFPEVGPHGLRGSCTRCEVVCVGISLSYCQMSVREVVAYVVAITSEHPLCIAALWLSCFLTSPPAVFHLVCILFRAPYHMLHAGVRCVAPRLFAKDVSSETVVVTGGGGGIGRLMACEFAKLGAVVVLIDKNEVALEEAKCAVEAVAQKAGRVMAFAADLADREATYAVMGKVHSAVGFVTILINNAGIATGRSLMDSPDHLIELSMAVNVRAHFWTVKSVLPAMLAANHGHIVTIASSAGLLGVPGLADYSASKFAAVGFDESLRLEVRKQKKKGVFTTLVCPFVIKTGMFAEARSRWPRVLPLLEPEYAASKIVQGIRCNQTVILLPAAIHLIPILKALLPVAIADTLVEWFGVLETNFQSQSTAVNAAPQLTAKSTRKSEVSKGRRRSVSPSRNILRR